MGLLNTTKRFYQDNSTSIRFPETINVHEHKAPTDESIRIMEEMHEKALQNIVAKVSVNDNLVSGECFAIEQPWAMDDIRFVFKFKINGQDFVVDKQMNKMQVGWDQQRNVAALSEELKSAGLAVMLWYALKVFTAVAYEQIMKKPFPKELLTK
jgi:hypothetical protein